VVSFLHVSRLTFYMYFSQLFLRNCSYPIPIGGLFPRV
jgi:hypothetical protein